MDLCECCGVNGVEVKDYREDERTGNIDKFLVCRNCMNLNNYWFYKLLDTETLLGKKRIIGRIVEGNWKEWRVE